jgi:uncharacterized protein YegP (UPF0339 family)
MRFKIKRGKSETQPFYWVIVASNGQTLATSETYTSKSGCTNAIETVKKEAGNAPTDDET